MIIYKIKTTIDYLIVEYGHRKVKILKDKICGYNVVYGTTPKFEILLDSGSSPLVIKYLDSTILFNGITQTTLALFDTTLSNELQVGIPEIFIATPGQTAFATTFTASATNVRIYVNDIRNSALSGWTFPLGVPTFAAGMAGGELVLIERLR